MKRYIPTSSDISKLQIIVEVEFVNETESVAAAYELENLRNSKSPPVAKDALIDSQVLADYHAFVETIEDLITDYFGLDIYYKNDSPYFGALAVDSTGKYILDCEAVIRISTHDPHRTPESVKEKVKQQDKLKGITNGAKLQPVRKNIIINDESFSNYDEAYEFVFPIIERAAEVLNRKK